MQRSCLSVTPISRRGKTINVHIFMAVLRSRCGHYIFALWFLLSSFFLFLASQPSQIGCLPYLHTWCSPSANLGCWSETCCTRLAGNRGRKNIAKTSPSGRHRTICRAISSQVRHARIDNRKKTCYATISPPHVRTIW